MFDADIAVLCDKTELSMEQIGEIYRKEFDRLAESARIPMYLEILAMRSTRSMLRGIGGKRGFGGAQHA